jgi:hypothetical protein
MIESYSSRARQQHRQTGLLVHIAGLIVQMPLVLIVMPVLNALNKTDERVIGLRAGGVVVKL